MGDLIVRDTAHLATAGVPPPGQYPASVSLAGQGSRTVAQEVS